MNLEKHNKNLAQEWLEGEESLVPSCSRSVHVLSAYIKIHRPKVRRRPLIFKPSLPARPRVLDPNEMRDPARNTVIRVHHSPSGSWEHLQKLKHLGRMRASFEYIVPRRPPVVCSRMAAQPPRNSRYTGNGRFWGR
jgi:hypothetical protein